MAALSVARLSVALTLGPSIPRPLTNFQPQYLQHRTQDREVRPPELRKLVCRRCAAAVCQQVSGMFLQKSVRELLPPLR